MSAFRIAGVLCAAMLGVAAVETAVAGIAERADRAKVAGVDIVVYPMNESNVVTIAGRLAAGNAYASPANIATAALAGRLLDKGTTRQDKLTIAKQLDDVGALLSFNVEAQSLTISGKSLRKDLPLLIRLLAEELRSPAYSAQELRNEITQLEAALRTSQEDVNFRAKDEYSRVVYPIAHPNRPAPVQEWLQALRTITADDIREFHKRYYGPASLTLVFAGDVDAKRIRAEVAKAFAGWTGGVSVNRSFKGEPASLGTSHRIPMKDKASVAMLLGMPTGLRYQDEDSLALQVGTAVLGSGMTSRLNSTLRDQEGLTYFMIAALTDDTYVDGSWMVAAAFAPNLLDKGVRATRREIENWWRNGVTAFELATRKTNLMGSYQVSLATTEGMATALLQTLNRGLPLQWLDEYPHAIEALTLEQVNAAIRKHVDPGKLVLVEAGTFEEQ
jgi:zinc protease